MVLARDDAVKVEAREPSVFCVGPDCVVARREPVAVPLTARDHFAEHFAGDFAHALEEARHEDAGAGRK